MSVFNAGIQPFSQQGSIMIMPRPSLLSGSLNSRSCSHSRHLTLARWHFIHNGASQLQSDVSQDIESSIQASPSETELVKHSARKRSWNRSAVGMFVQGAKSVPRRTLFYVPGSSQKMIDKAWTLQADNIVCRC